MNINEAAAELNEGLERIHAYDNLNHGEMIEALRKSLIGNGYDINGMDGNKEVLEMFLAKAESIHENSSPIKDRSERYCAEFMDCDGWRGVLPFVDRKSCERWTADNPQYRKVNDIGYGEIRRADGNQIALVSKDERMMAHIHPRCMEVLKGARKSFAREKSDWQDAPSGISSYIKAFALADTSCLDEDAPNDAWRAMHAKTTPEREMREFQHEKAIKELIEQMGDRPEITLVTKGAAELINNCRIQFKPDKFSRYLDAIAMQGSPFLFEKVLELAILRADGGYQLITESLQDSGARMLISLALTEESVRDMDFLAFQPAEKTYQTQFGEEPIEAFNESTIKEAIRYIVKYRLLLEAEKTPIMLNVTGSRGEKLQRGINTIPRYRQASLTKRYKAAAAEADRNERVEMDKEGKHLATVHVSGFIRQQAYGKGRKDRKAIWVDGFERGQWIRDGIIIRKVNP